MKRKHNLGDAPIEPKFEELMNVLAQGIDRCINESPSNRTNGFVLMIFPFSEHGARTNYISNANREDIITLLKEQLSRFEGMAETVGHA